MRLLAGRKALVTGGSRGIGQAIVTAFANAGAEVLVVSRSRPDQTLLDHAGVRWRAVDLADTDQVNALFAEIATQWGALDVLVNNAGVQVAASLTETSDEAFDRVTAVNMKGLFLCCRAAIPLMKGAEDASIINIGSIAGMTPDYGLPVYSASKAWVHGMTKALAIEHGPDNIRCNALAPTWTRTELSIELFQEEADPAHAEQATHQRHPLGRMAEPEDIARAAVWLASTASRFINGQIIAVDGGLGAASQINPALDFQP